MCIYVTAYYLCAVFRCRRVVLRTVLSKMKKVELKIRDPSAHLGAVGLQFMNYIRKMLISQKCFKVVPDTKRLFPEPETF